MLGGDSVDPEDLNDGLSKFLMKAYMTKGIIASSIAELRWQLFSKKQLTAEKLPPTMGALKWKVKRAYYVASVWKKSLQSFMVEYLDPLNFGWNSNCSNGQQLLPTLTEEPPAPQATLELTYCGCKKTKCAAGSCGCHKIGLKCTELCNCIDCSNEGIDFDLENVNDIDED